MAMKTCRLFFATVNLVREPLCALHTPPPPMSMVHELNEETWICLWLPVVRYCFHRCLSVHMGEGVPQPGPNGGGGTPTYLPSSQGTYPLPGQVPIGALGYRTVPTPQPRYLPPTRSGQVGGGGRTRRNLPLLDALQSVCLLRSHMRTFFLNFFLGGKLQSKFNITRPNIEYLLHKSQFHAFHKQAGFHSQRIFWFPFPKAT